MDDISWARRGWGGGKNSSFICDRGDGVRGGAAAAARRARRAASMDAWIDTYHAVRSLTREGTFVFLTDSAVGPKEEDNLRHLVTNLGSDVPRDGRAVPDVQAFARLLPAVRGARAAARVSSAGRARRRQERRRAAMRWSTRGSCARRSGAAMPALTLGGWANPHADRRAQVDHLLADTSPRSST